MSLADCRPDRDPLGTGSHRIRCVLDIYAVDKLVIVGEEAGADPELRVWAVRSVFGRAAARMERLELSAGDTMLDTGL